MPPLLKPIECSVLVLDSAGELSDWTSIVAGLYLRRPVASGSTTKPSAAKSSIVYEGIDGAHLNKAIDNAECWLIAVSICATVREAFVSWTAMEQICVRDSPQVPSRTRR